MDLNSFFSITDKQAVLLIHDEYHDVLQRLKRAYAVRNESISRPTESPSPSQILYGTEYDEINRTIVGVLALRWLWRGEYSKFVGSQDETVRLMPASFNWMQAYCNNCIRDDAALQAIITAIMTNDLGKDHRLASDYAAKTGEDISSLNHDLILMKAVQAGLVPCINRLEGRYKDYIIEGIKLGATFIFGQMAQAENAPACLAAILEMRHKEFAFAFRFMEQLLDVAGADGQHDWTCAKKLNEPIYQGFRTVNTAVEGVISGTLEFRDAYDTVLSSRNDLLVGKGFRSLTLHLPDERALLRLLCLGNVFDLGTAELYDSSWRSLEKTTRAALEYRLNLDGSVAEPAVQPTYMPALLTNSLAATSDRIETLQGVLRYLAHVLLVQDEQKGEESVIERSVLPVLQRVVKAGQISSSFFSKELVEETGN